MGVVFVIVPSQCLFSSQDSAVAARVGYWLPFKLLAADVRRTKYPDGASP